MCPYNFCRVFLVFNNRLFKFLKLTFTYSYTPTQNLSTHTHLSFTPSHHTPPTHPHTHTKKQNHPSIHRYGDKLVVVRLNQKGYLDKIEKAVQDGEVVLIENVEESIDPVLNPVIGRNTIKKVLFLHSFYYQSTFYNLINIITMIHIIIHKYYLL